MLFLSHFLFAIAIIKSDCMDHTPIVWCNGKEALFRTSSKESMFELICIGMRIIKNRK